MKFLLAMCLLFISMSTIEAKTEAANAETSIPFTKVPSMEFFETAVKSVTEQLDAFKGLVRDLSRQTMLLQFAMEERVRSDGDSGIKLLRADNKGPDNYYQNGIVGNNFNSIHDHSNFDRTVGMGEVIAVMNGVEFRTRHNDYKLVMPSTTSKEYHATEKIPFPKIPDEVLQKTTVDEQIAEMHQWFKAFATQNTTLRNYPEYFKPVMCYMEGAWTLDKDLSEPFESDRHHVDATSWFDLQEKIRYTSFSGTKNRLENLAYLPTTIMAVNEETGVPKYAQWNYRILCSPLKEDVPLSSFRVVDDVAYRVPRKRSPAGVEFSRGARFRLYNEDKDKFTKYSVLDRLFESIPGKDNTPGNMTQTTFGEEMYNMGTGKLLNTGFYHRMFKFQKAGAMGLKTVSRGFNDANMWVAQTTQERVAPIKHEECVLKWIMVRGTMRRRKVCTDKYSRYTYAIPLEIIYLTPLQNWNPYDLETGKNKTDVIKDKRNGGLEKGTAYNGTTSSLHYMTPVEFFSGKSNTKDAADTTRKAVGVLDKNGDVKKTTASGVKIMLEAIQDVGKVRLRYPIAPVHGEGSSVWKELNALKTLIRDNKGSGTGTPTSVGFVMSPTFRRVPGEHDHEFVLTYDQFIDMVHNDMPATVVTSDSHDHTHTLKVEYKANKNRFEYTLCDGNRNCWDGHPRIVTPTTDVETEMQMPMF